MGSVKPIQSPRIMKTGMATHMAPSKAEALSLFHSLLRTACKFCDYNIREYTKRRTIDASRHNGDLPNPFSAALAYAHGKSQLEVTKRQAIVYSLYTPKIRSVMEANH